MHISLRLLRYFVAAAETGSTTAAARALNVSQPSISVAIRELESVFNEALFTRGLGPGLIATQFGERKLSEARQLLAVAAAFEADDGGNAAAGEVRLGVFTTIAPVYLPSLLRIAQQRYPKLSIHCEEGDLAQLESRLQSHRIDLALTYDVGLPAGIERECLADLKPHALIPAGSRLGKTRGPVSLRQLVKEPFILIDLPYSREFLLAPFWQYGLSPEVRYRVASIELARAMVAEGLGVALLITQKSATMHTPTLVERPIREETVRQPLVIARAAQALHTRASQLVAECIHAAVQETLVRRSGRPRTGETPIVAPGQSK